METRSRTSTSIFEMPTVALSKTLRPPSANDSGMNSSTSQLRASNETLASNEPPLDPADPNANKTIYDFQVLNCFHELYDLAQHKGSVVLICNVASKDKEYTEACYTILTTLYRKYRNEKFAVLAFPCNEFGSGEPGNEDEIAENLSCVFPRIGEVDFPIMAKVEVNGDHASPLFTFLKSRIRGTLGQTSVKWNFTSFLCDASGLPFARFAPGSTLSEMDARIDELMHPKPQSAAPADAATDSTLPSAGVVEAAAVDDTPTPDDFSGCPTPPPSEVAQHKAELAEREAGFSPQPLLPSAVTATDVTSRGSPSAEGADSGCGVGNGSSSALFDKTTNTLEGAEA